MSTEPHLNSVPDHARNEFDVMADGSSILDKADPALMDTIREATSAAWASGGAAALKVAMDVLELEKELKPEEVVRFRTAIGHRHEIKERTTRKPRAKKAKRAGGKNTDS